MKKIISGPCSVESEFQFERTVKRLLAIGVTHIRCGVWKPRTKPGQFEGLGEEALKIIQTVKRIYPIITTYVEIANKEQYILCEKYSIDCYWIGARTVSNPFSVEELATSINPKRTVLIKNPINPDINLWKGAVERFKNRGFSDLKLIYRGFNTETPGKYRNAPLWHILTAMTTEYNLETYIDPSHIAGRRDLLLDVINDANFLGFQNLFVETHYYPTVALTDSEQQVTPSDLVKIILESKSKLAIDFYRDQIDEIDSVIFTLFENRMELSDKIGKTKKENHLPILDQSRFDSIVKSKEVHKLDPHFIRDIYKAIHVYSLKKQGN